MELSRGSSSVYPRLSKPVPCAQCGRALLAPAWCEPLNDTQFRYLWSCRDCGYQFEATVFFHEPEQPAKAA